MLYAAIAYAMIGLGTGRLASVLTDVYSCVHGNKNEMEVSYWAPMILITGGFFILNHVT